MTRRTEWLLALFALALLLFNYPLIALFDLPRAVLGMPLLWLYLFAAWGGLIVVLAWVQRR